MLLRNVAALEHKRETVKVQRHLCWKALNYWVRLRRYPSVLMVSPGYTAVLLPKLQLGLSAKAHMTVNPALQVSVQPITTEDDRYLFTVHNLSQREVRNIEFSFYDLLGPGDFGLDDTHMPTSLTSEPKVVIAMLPPGQFSQIELKKWGPISRYKGGTNRTVRGRFSDGSPMNGHTLTHEVQVTVLVEPQFA